MIETHNDQQKELEASEKLEQEENAKVAQFQKKLEELRTVESDYAAKTAEWDVEVEKMHQKQEFGQQNVDRIDAEIERHEKEKQEIEESMAAGAEEVTRKRHNIEEILLTIEASHKAQSDAEKKLQEDTEQKEKLSERQKTFFARREELSGQMSGLGWLKKQLPGLAGKRIAALAVGCAPADTPDLPESMEKLFGPLPQVRGFYCQGGLDYEHMGAVDRAMMAALRASLRGKPEMADMLAGISRSFDAADRGSLAPLVQWARNA